MIIMMGQRIKEARKNAGLTQTELAKKLGIKSAEISQYESDKRTPRWNIFNKLLDELNVTADEMLGREVTLVSEDDEYKIKASKKDMQILKSLKNYPKLYKVLLLDPNRNLKVINNNLKRVFPE